jgi:YegS/Rv2252/BmrU family lipid kinase
LFINFAILFGTEKMANEGETIKTFIIVNPHSAGGATMRRWPSASEILEKAIGKFDYEFTNAAGVAAMLAKKAVNNGYGRIISVGGDGTLYEVLQGLFNKGSLINPNIVLGTLPFGTGTDFARSINVSNKIEEAAKRLSRGQVKKIDLGLAKLRDHQGKIINRYFINMSDVGLGGEVVERVNRSSKFFGGSMTYLLSSLVSFSQYKPRRVKIKADDAEFDLSITSVLVANGRYCGGGMLIAPEAKVDDGLFDIVIIEGLPKWNLITFAPKLYSGKILSSPGVRHLQAKVISIESDQECLVNLDGEQPGTVPVEFSILPQAINFIC